MKPKSKILIIAGSDSSGGAGIQADIKTVTTLGSFAMTAITAVTVQNTQGIKSVIPISPKEIKNQIIFTSKDIKPDAIKIGMLHSPQVILEVLESLKKIKVNEASVDKFLYTKGIPNPDILIRTGNTNRLSNFLLWQLAYTEIFFHKKLWPDFKAKDYKQIINKFKSLKRNFGNI